MAAPTGDPYSTLGVSPGVSDRELQAAYRRLVQLHHPDHNQGSAESARRFEEIQDAYARVRRLRARSGSGAQTAPTDPDVEARLADLERELRQAHEARERARRAAAEAAAAERTRPSDEELGYVTTDDSLAKILADARSELSERFADARELPIGERVAQLLDELAATLRGGGSQGPGNSKPER